MFPFHVLSSSVPLPQSTDVPFEPGTQRRPIGTHLRRQPVDAPQRGVGERFQGRQEDRGNPSNLGYWIVRPKASTPFARLCALDGVILIAIRRDGYFFLLRDDTVPFPLTLRTAIAGRQGRSDGDPKPMPTWTFDFGRARCFLILRHIGHLGSATLRATERRPLVLIAVNGTR